MPERRFTESEVREILRRSVEIQSGSHSEGATLDQLLHASSELGLDPEAVRKAASDVVLEPARPRGSWLFGGPSTFNLDRIVTGTVSEDRWPLMLADLRAATGRVGKPSTLGKSFEWSSYAMDSIHLSVTAAGQHSRVRITSRFTDWMLVYIAPLLGLFFGFVVAMAIFHHIANGPTPFMLLLFVPMVLGAVWARWFFGKTVKRCRREAQALMDAAESFLAGPAGTANCIADSVADSDPIRTRLNH